MLNRDQNVEAFLNDLVEAFSIFIPKAAEELELTLLPDEITPERLYTVLGAALDLTLNTKGAEPLGLILHVSEGEDEGFTGLMGLKGDVNPVIKTSVLENYVFPEMISKAGLTKEMALSLVKLTAFNGGVSLFSHMDDPGRIIGTVGMTYRD